MLEMMETKFLPLDYEQNIYQQNQKNMQKIQTVADITEIIEKRLQKQSRKTCQRLSMKKYKD